MNSKMLPELLLKTSAYRILSFLTFHPSDSFYDKEISEKTGVSRGATNQVLNDFFKNNLVTREKRGKMWLYTLSDQPLVKYFRIYENLVELTELKNHLFPIAKRLILFGSAAQGEDTSASDIDLFVISDQPDDVFSKIRTFKFERELKPIVRTPLEYATSQNKDKAFYEQVERGITLFEKEADEERL